MSLKSQPERWCVYDRCHPFKPVGDSHVYCTNCNCKRKAENSRKRLTNPILDDTLLWELQENRKLGRMDTAQAKNKWLLDNSRIGFFDIESMDLDANRSLMLCATIKEYKGDTYTFVSKSPKSGGMVEDKDALIEARDLLESFDYICTFYGSRFDLPYFNTRLLMHGERPVNQLRHIDLYYIARTHLKLYSNRLQVVTEALFGEAAKTRILWPIWLKALGGSKKDMKYITDHCEIDVAELEKVFDKLRGFINFSATRWRVYGASY